MKSNDFATLLCSRLCHDLISPVGAITNALELLDEDIDPETERQVMNLLKQSAAQTSQKLQYFRLAFGAAGGFSENLDIREAEKATEGYLESLRITPQWAGAARSASKSGIKLLLCLILVAGESLVRGGELTIDLGDNGDGFLSSISLTAKGSRIILQSGVEGTMLGTSAVPADPRTAPAHLARLVAKELGLSIYTDKTAIEADEPCLVLGAQ